MHLNTFNFIQIHSFLFKNFKDSMNSLHKKLLNDKAGFTRETRKVLGTLALHSEEEAYEAIKKELDKSTGKNHSKMWESFKDLYRKLRGQDFVATESVAPKTSKRAADKSKEKEKGKKKKTEELSSNLSNEEEKGEKGSEGTGNKRTLLTRETAFAHQLNPPSTLTILRILRLISSSRALTRSHQ